MQLAIHRQFNAINQRADQYHDDIDSVLVWELSRGALPVDLPANRYVPGLLRCRVDGRFVLTDEFDAALRQQGLTFSQVRADIAEQELRRQNMLPEGL